MIGMRYKTGMDRPNAIIVCPAASQSNNGNWRTAQRWRRMLAPIARTTVVRDGT